MQYNNSLCGWCMLAEPIWRQVPSAGLVCWASWRSCGGGSAWRMRSWPSRCPSEAMSPPCCNSRTTARCVLLPQAMFPLCFTRFIIPCLSLFSSSFQKVELFNLLQSSTCFFRFCFNHALSCVLKILGTLSTLKVLWPERHKTCFKGSSGPYGPCLPDILLTFLLSLILVYKYFCSVCSLVSIEISIMLSTSCLMRWS